jgi:hypothetical protein
MARKINDKLICRLLDKNDLYPLLDYVKSNPEKLRLEVRQKGHCNIYYKKCKILDLGLKSNHIDKKYFKDENEHIKIKDYALKDPKKYFEYTMSTVDSWLETHKKNEFETQQKIAFHNQDKNDKYLILDMEYNFNQDEIKREKRIKRAGFDLLGIERKTGNIKLFEVKKGLKALKGKAGIGTHILDFERCLFGLHKTVFRKNLLNDVSNIILDKIKLELLDELQVATNLSNIELIFIYEPEGNDISSYNETFDIEYASSNSSIKYNTIFVSKNNYKLK